MKKINEQQLNKKFLKSVNIRGNKISIYLVNGDYVRTYLYIDYLFGGYKQAMKELDFIPDKEIWLDSLLPEGHDRNGIITHETTEYPLVVYDKIPYPKAHARANEAELKERQDTYNDEIVDIV